MMLGTIVSFISTHSESELMYNFGFGYITTHVVNVELQLIQYL